MTKYANHEHCPIFIAHRALHTYTSGELVRGVVRVDPKTRPHRIVLTFTGRLHVVIVRSNGQSSQTFKAKPELFSRELILFSSPTPGASYDIVRVHGVTGDDRVELPFEFEFPECVEGDGGGLYRPEDGFESQPGHVLPPSFGMFDGLYHGGESSQRVDYFLEAKLYTSSTGSPSAQVRSWLSYRPPAPALPAIPTALPQPTYYGLRGTYARTYRLHPHYDPNEKLLAKIKHSWTKHNASTPFARFRVSATCPAVLTTGCPIPISLSLLHMDRSKDIPDPPPIYLRRVRVRLTSTLDVRIARYSVFSTRQALRDSHRNKGTLLDQEYKTGNEMLLYDGLELATVRFPEEIAPGFSSYAMHLEHQLEVRIWGECAKEKFEVVGAFGRVVVVADVERPRREMLVAEERPPEFDEDGAPPPYQGPG
ncbi:hypothetical protein BU26DRAFT_517382 [Trematosphaeria pertusa]|uniref:Arrestin-like N-terminal domain-containing protein n=1 Tax=Trematosphaeria pertusa TaxID=390896 RepID=A0A6A6IJG1_9PLEO|nr:uncharacterized protein BU26DRAFT_517382 [Trematosphaeria pertusa]KAF2250551.1 hypothetical protein BU26DRAFT_517382 [Trematosphaeria pertusa]